MLTSHARLSDDAFEEGTVEELIKSLSIFPPLAIVRGDVFASIIGITYQPPSHTPGLVYAPHGRLRLDTSDVV